MIEKPSYNPDQLVSQPSDIQVICSACSLINALILADVKISSEEKEETINKVMLNGKQLSMEERRSIIAEHGLTSNFGQYGEIASYFDDPYMVVDYLAEKLTLGPALMKIPSYMSKRNLLVQTKIAAETIEHGSDQRIVHSVVTARFNDALYIIDPYDPTDPEIFDLKDQNEKLNYLLWFTSTYLDAGLSSEEKKQSYEDVVAHFNSLINNSERRADFIEGSLMTSGALFIKS